VAVELALRGLQVGAANEVLLAGYDFPGNFRSIEAVGATPVVVDLAPHSYCLDVEQLDAACSPQVKAVIVSHLYGELARLDEITRWASERNVAVVEDACQVPGATVCGRPAGTWGDAGVLSFGGSKLVTAGRGGAVVTPRADVYQRLKIYAERGNHAYPLSELQAAVLPPQWEKLDARNRYRRERVRELLRHCTGLTALRPLPPERVPIETAYYKVAWRYAAQHAGGRSREEFLAAVQAEGVAIDAGFRGFARRSARRCRVAGPLPNSRLAAEATVLLHHPVLLQAPETVAHVTTALRKVLHNFQASADRKRAT
jgi:dTDP-4-amino-4,6-dideoxygalactose transaminase